MARKKVTSVPALADWGAVDNALRDIRECQHTLAEMAVQRDRQIDSIKADYAQGALPLQNRVKALESEVKAYVDLIKTYDRENALFYCDPPYFETEKYYRARFQESDHKRLADALHSIKGRFLLSYNDCPQVRELYADCIIEPVSRRNTLSAQSADGYKEVLVRNYEL